jgi:hypothetical protein
MSFVEAEQRRLPRLSESARTQTVWYMCVWSAVGNKPSQYYIRPLTIQQCCDPCLWPQSRQSAKRFSSRWNWNSTTPLAQGVAIVHICSYFHKFNPGVDRWQLLATHTSKSLCEPDKRISMFNCDVSQTLSAINSAADSIKIISRYRSMGLSHRRVCPPTLWSGGRAHSLAATGVGESQFQRGDIHCGALYIYFVPLTNGFGYGLDPPIFVIDLQEANKN